MVAVPKRIKPYNPPSPPTIAIVTDYPSQKELINGEPLTDFRGKILDTMLQSAGIARSACYLTSVLKTRPPNAKVEKLCNKKAPSNLLAKEAGWKTYHLPAVSIGAYLHPRYCLDLYHLQEELQYVRPNIIIALGSFAVWALLRKTGIAKWRGTVHPCELVPGLKVLPTFHPGAIAASWDLRTISIVDLHKANRESEYPEIRREHRTIYIAEDLADIRGFIQENLVHAEEISWDIETYRNEFISCISFSPDPSESFVIPITTYDGTSHEPYWETADEEHAVWLLIQEISRLKTSFGGQNILYDIQYTRKMGINFGRIGWDTMIQHHAMQPELPKTLGFLASVYTNDPAWKEMRTKGKAKTNKMKRED